MGLWTLAGATVLAWAIAFVALPVPPTITALCGVATWAAGARLSRPGWVLAGALMLIAASASFQTSRAFASDLDDIVIDEVVTVASDPEPIRRGVAFDINYHGTTLRAFAFGSAAGHLRDLLRGERVGITGTIRADAPDEQRRWGRAGSVSVERVEAVRARQRGRVHYRIANALRRSIERGADSLNRDQRSLLAGFVYGDDRAQSDIVADDFRAAGLTHLLAVSGSNVAFVLIIAGPLLRRFDLGGRLVVTFIILFGFATLTRFEPSVMRASVMAAVATVGVTIGRPASGIRLLLMSVIVLMLAQPTMARSLAFQLSVLASGGILVLAPFGVDRVPGPRWWREAIAVTTAAQLAVAPLLVAVFDTVPIASLPANVVGGPVAGPIMMWGLTAGVVAGMVPGAIATVLHLPTRLMIDWVAGVAHVAAAARLGDLGAVGIAVLSVTVGVVVFVRRRRARRVAWAVMALCLVGPAVVLRVAPPSPVVVDGIEVAWQDRAHTVVAPGESDTADLLEALRLAGVGDIDVLVLARGSLADWSQYRTLARRWGIETVWVPDDDIIGTAVMPDTPAIIAVDGHDLVVRHHDGQLSVSQPGRSLQRPGEP